MPSQPVRPDSPGLFTGLSAFPLTPLDDDVLDERSYAGLITRLAAAGVDSITALGSTGSYAYLTDDERARAIRIAVQHASGIPVFAGVGALRTSRVLANVRSAEKAGAVGVLLAPVSYQPLTADDVFELFREVTASTDLPVIVYDNPGTTHFTFTRDLYARIAELPGIASIKIPPVPAGLEAAREHVTSIRAIIPAHVTIGISGDAWYTAIGGTLPEPIVAITRAAQRGRVAEAEALSERLAPIWELFGEFGGSIRVTAAIAEQLGLVAHRCLPRPILGLDEAQRARVSDALTRAGVAG